MCADKIKAPDMVYASGEEMSHYVMNMALEKWVAPYVDTTKWHYYDLSAKRRDETNDAVVQDLIDAGKKYAAVFKEPTITPTAEQAKEMGLSKAWGSPNKKIREGWNGYAISRDTIHIEGVELGYKNVVMFDRYAVGGEYASQFYKCGAGRVQTLYFQGDDDTNPIVVHEETFPEKSCHIVVTFVDPLDNVPHLAHHFFSRTLEAAVVPYVVTKKTAFKYQEPFWELMKEVFDEHYKDKFAAKGLLKATGGELGHLLSDAAVMKINSWKDGNYGMVSLNYDGDVLTDGISQIHRSPAFLSSVLNGISEDGTQVKEFEASHGTGHDQWVDHLAGKETSFNPLGMVFALAGSMDYSAKLAGADKEREMKRFTSAMMEAMNDVIRSGRGTKDMSGDKGLTTEEFVDAVADAIRGKMAQAAAA